MADLKKILKKTKKNHQLSLALYATGNSDAMYLAGLMADEKLISKAQLQKWANEAYWSYLSEYTVPWVAAESPHGWEWGREKGEGRMGKGEWRTENGEWGKANGERGMENGERRTENRERGTENGERRTENGEWRTENGERRMEKGEWGKENGEWRKENGERRMGNC